MWLLVLILLLGVSFPVAADTPRAHEVRTVPATGAVYYPSVEGLSPHHGGSHYCSASVVHSPTKDLVVTAAHCVFGAGPGIEFAPLLHDDALPHGVWKVEQIYVDPSWITSFDPRHDVVFLRVALRDGQALEDVVPGRRLGLPTAGSRVHVTGYPMGRGGRPITCAAPLRRVRGYSGIRCRGFGAGTSGGPWVQGRHVVGVIGGLEQGGCAPGVEYSTPFGADVRALYRRAVAGGPGDVLPVGFAANAC